MRLSTKLLLLTSLAALSGCADFGYYLQSANGHLSMLRAAKPVSQWLDDAQTSPDLKARLALAQRIRRFAVTDLGLPDNPSYNQYADLKRRAVVWNVVAAPELSLKLKTWCFPVTGCVGYRGYFDEGEARALAAQLKGEGLEVSVYGVPAYSTLGWMNWAGGDPLLNTFINYPEGELARLIFHELAHQVVYARDDTMFNESFATAVERLGGARWLAQQGSAGARSEFAATASQRAQFRSLALATRRVLSGLYGDAPSGSAPAPAPAPVSASVSASMSASVSVQPAADKAGQLAAKNKAMQDFRNQYAALKANWVAAAAEAAGAPSVAVLSARFSGYDAWVANANNATFGAQAAYDELVPDFEALFARISSDTANDTKQAGDPWPRFYAAVKRLADLPAAERRQALKSGG